MSNTLPIHITLDIVPRPSSEHRHSLSIPKPQPEQPSERKKQVINIIVNIKAKPSQLRQQNTSVPKHHQSPAVISQPIYYRHSTPIKRPSMLPVMQVYTPPAPKIIQQPFHTSRTAKRPTQIVYPIYYDAIKQYKIHRPGVSPDTAIDQQSKIKFEDIRINKPRRSMNQGSFGIIPEPPQINQQLKSFHQQHQSHQQHKKQSLQNVSFAPNPTNLNQVPDINSHATPKPSISIPTPHKIDSCQRKPQPLQPQHRKHNLFSCFDGILCGGQKDYSTIVTQNEYMVGLRRP